jgi:heat-inducible transcriptional repressor
VQLLPRRQREVLQATVRHYVDTTEPVGSKTLVQRFGLDASPATVRSAMGALEQRGLLTQPHTSAGRIPSQLGYRHYVDCLLPAPGVAVGQLERELMGLSLQWAALDDLLLQLARRLCVAKASLRRERRPQVGQRARRVAVEHGRARGRDRVRCHAGCGHGHLEGTHRGRGLGQVEGAEGARESV